MASIPGTERKEELVLKDVVYVEVGAVEGALRTVNWRLGYTLMAHSSQELNIHNAQKFWIIDNYLQASNPAYLAVSRVGFMQQLERVTCPPEEGFEEKPPMCGQRLQK